MPIKIIVVHLCATYPLSKTIVQLEVIDRYKIQRWIINSVSSSSSPLYNVVDIKDKYLQALHSPGTKELNKTILQILTHLFTTFGDVTPNGLQGMPSQVESLTFLP